MGKILELFNERHGKGQMYRESPVNKAYGVDKIREAGAGHPLQYVYPGAEGVSVKDDEALVGGSISHLRDTDRISEFKKTQAGARFLQTQIDLQRSNPWAQTRQYRTDNITDHTDPTTHKQRHGTEISLSSALSSVHELPFLGKVQAGIPGEFAIQLNSGTVQTETATKLISSSGPVYYRLHSKEGMLHTGNLSLLDVVSATVRRTISNKINDLLEPFTRFVSNASARISSPAGSTMYPRPEIEYNYLEKIYNKNKGLENTSGPTQMWFHENDPRASGSYKHGHIYLALEKGETAGTYIDPDNRLNTRRRERGGRAGFVSQFLPSFSDISLFRTIKRFKVDINSIIDRVKGGGSALEQTGFGPTDLGLRYARRAGSSTERTALWDQIRTHTQGESSADLFRRTGRATLRNIFLGNVEGTESDESKLNSYIQAISKYKGANKRISIGVTDDAGGNTTQIDFPDGRPSSTVFKARKRYYKDWMQVSGSFEGTIFRNKKPLDSDSIDVIFGVMGQPEEVRFRAFIEDIKESVQPSYNENNYIGRYETFYTYDKVIRNVSFQLRLHAFSVEEREHIMKKMAYLTSLAYPESSNNYLTPLVTNLTIGKVYTKQPCLLQGLTHSIESDVSWDIDEQTPMSILCAIDVRLLDKEVYTYQNMKGNNHPFRLYLGTKMSADEEAIAAFNLPLGI